MTIMLAYEDRENKLIVLDRLLIAKYIWDAKKVHLDADQNFFEWDETGDDKYFACYALKKALNLQRIDNQENDSDIFEWYFDWPLLEGLFSRVHLMEKEQMVKLVLTLRQCNFEDDFDLFTGKAMFCTNGRVRVQIDWMAGLTNSLIKSFLDLENELIQLEKEITEEGANNE